MRRKDLIHFVLLIALTLLIGWGLTPSAEAAGPKWIGTYRANAGPKEGEEWDVWFYTKKCPTTMYYDMPGDGSNQTWTMTLLTCVAQ